MTATLDLIHMDIEGSGPSALCGAQLLIERSPNVTIITEWAVPMMAERSDVGGYVTWLRDFGFRFWLIDRETADLTPLDPANLSGLPHCDLLISRVDPPPAPRTRANWRRPWRWGGYPVKLILPTLGLPRPAGPAGQPDRPCVSPRALR